MIATQQPNGSFAVQTASGIVFAHIVKSSNGWRVVNHIPGRRSSRTVSATPEQAAAKYFASKVTFQYATK
jgi:hypothetical protein